MGEGQCGPKALAQHSEGIKPQVGVGNVHQGTAHAGRTAIQLEAGSVAVCLHGLTDGDGMQHFPAWFVLQCTASAVSKWNPGIVNSNTYWKA